MVERERKWNNEVNHIVMILDSIIENRHLQGLKMQNKASLSQGFLSLLMHTSRLESKADGDWGGDQLIFKVSHWKSIVHCQSVNIFILEVP